MWPAAKTSMFLTLPKKNRHPGLVAR